MEETIVRLNVISNDQTPEMVTKAVGLKCDHCWYVGDTRAHTTIKEESYGWVIDSGLSKATGLEEQINALFSIVGTRADALKALSATATVELSCVIYASAAPTLYFNKSVIGKLALLGASLDIDIYIVETDSE